MIIHNGVQARLIDEVTLAAGTTSKTGSVQTDSLLATLWVDSVSSGTLSVSVYTLTDTGKEALLFTFPTISAPTSNLLLKKSGVSMANFRIVATYTGVCQYEVYIRAVEGIGESNSKIIGAADWEVTQSDVTTTAALLIPASMTDRNGIIIKNWSSTGNLYIAPTLGQATTADGWPLAPRDHVAMDIAAGAEIYAIADAGTIDVRISEAGG